jgi:uncharacterized surface protein with fasciclin (FAS1) repeats
MFIASALSRPVWAAVTALGAPIMSGCESDTTGAELAPGNIVEVAQEAGSFGTLLTALGAAGLDEVLSGAGPFTVFAPTDAAFGAIPSDVLADVLADQALLTSVLTYHVVPGRVSASEVVALSSAPTVNGTDLAIEVVGGEVFINGIRVVTTDIEASNGIIHVIEGVLTPEPIANIVQTAAAAGGFTTLLTALEVAGLDDVLSGDGPFTVFAPTDAAFAQIPAADLNALLADVNALTSVLTYHVVAGEVLAADVVQLDSAPTVNGASVDITLQEGAVKVDGANVIATDIRARNGVIHVIDRVLLP